LAQGTVSDGHPKRGSPRFSARPLWPNGHIVLNGDSVPLQKRVHSSPSFLARVCCGQMARWSKKPLGTKVGQVTLLDGKRSPQNGAKPPIFGPCLLWPNGYMDQDTTWYGGRPNSMLLQLSYNQSYSPQSQLWQFVPK